MKRALFSLSKAFSPKPIDVSDTKKLVKFILKKGTLNQIEDILIKTKEGENLEVYEAIISRCTNEKLSLTSEAQRRLVSASDFLIDPSHKAQFEKVLALNSKLFPLIKDEGIQESIIKKYHLGSMTPAQITQLNENIKVFCKNANEDFIENARVHATALKDTHSESTDDNPYDMDVLMGGEELTFDFENKTMKMQDPSKTKALQIETERRERRKCLEDIAGIRFVAADEEITTMNPEDRKRLEDFQAEVFVGLEA